MMEVGDLRPEDCARARRGGAGGTGSQPPGCQGWQRANRATVSRPPRHRPCARRASAAYAEQLGWKRHAEGSKGDSQRR